MPLYDCGDIDCEECQREFGPNREKAIINFEAREAFQATGKADRSVVTDPTRKKIR